MIEKFSPKVYLNKERIYRSVPGAPRISRLYVWNFKLKEYGQPPDGKSYFASRYEPIASGKFKRKKKFFASVQEARNWQTGEKKGVSAHLPLSIKNQIEAKTDDAEVYFNKSYTVGCLLHDWQIQTWSTLRESSRIYYAKALPFYEPLFNVDVEKLTPKIINQWLALLKSESWLKNYKTTRNSLVNELEILGTILRWYIDTTEETKLVFPMRKHHKKAAIIKEGVVRKKRFMLPEELDLWLLTLKEVAPDFYPLAFVQTKQLMRISEAAAMKFSNLNLKSQTYRMCEHVFWPRIEGQSHRIIPGTKNMAPGQYFDVPLWDEVVVLLKKLQSTSTSDLIFHSNGNVLTYRQIQYAYNKAFKKAKLPYASTHVCRHTGATAFLDMTGDALALKEMGNWADLKVALEYGQVMNQRARKALEKADRNIRVANGEKEKVLAVG